MLKRDGLRTIFRSSFLFSLLFILNSVFVHAALLSPVTSRLRYVFFNMSGTAAFSVWLKFAFFVIVFAILYNAGLRAFKSAEAPMKRALAVLTFVIALTSAIFVPYKLLLYIFKTYYVILVVLFALLPALIGFIICNKVLHGDDRWHRFIRAIIYILITIFIFGLIGQVEAKSSPDTKLFMQVLEPLMWGAIIALVAGIWNLLMALGGDTVASHVPQMLGGTRGAPQPTPTTGPTTTTPPTTTPPTPPGGRVPQVTRVVPERGNQNSGILMLRVEGNNLDLVEQVIFPHASDNRYFLHQTHFPTLLNKTPTSFEVEITLNQNCSTGMPPGSPTDCHPGHYNIMYIWNGGANHDLRGNVFEVVAASPPPQQLLDEIRNFVQAMGHPPGTLSPAGTGLCLAMTNAGNRCVVEIRNAPNDATRRVNAPQHMPMLNALRTELANQRTRMEAILTHASYGAVPLNYQQAFEQAVAFFLNIEHNFTAIYLETIPWL